MKHSLVLAAALLMAGAGAAFAQQPSEPTVWGAPYHGPTLQGGMTASSDEIAIGIRGNARMMSLDATNGQMQRKRHRQH